VGKHYAVRKDLASSGGLPLLTRSTAACDVDRDSTLAEGSMRSFDVEIDDAFRAWRTPQSGSSQEPELT
jgi:hypothetical protein